MPRENNSARGSLQSVYARPGFLIKLKPWAVNWNVATLNVELLLTPDLFY